MKIRQKYLKISADDLWRVRDKLDGKKKSLKKTYKSSKEGNDKVYELNKKTASSWKPWRYCMGTSSKRVPKGDRYFEDILKNLSFCREKCAEASAVHERAETSLNEGLGVVRDQWASTEAATMALIVGTADGSENEIVYLNDALDLIDAWFLREHHEEEEEFELIGKEGKD